MKPNNNNHAYFVHISKLQNHVAERIDDRVDCNVCSSVESKRDVWRAIQFPIFVSKCSNSNEQQQNDDDDIGIKNSIKKLRGKLWNMVGVSVCIEWIEERFVYFWPSDGKRDRRKERYTKRNVRTRRKAKGTSGHEQTSHSESCKLKAKEKEKKTALWKQKMKHRNEFREDEMWSEQKIKEKKCNVTIRIFCVLPCTKFENVALYGRARTRLQEARENAEDSENE